LIVKAGHKTVTQAEIEAIFAEMDSDKNGTIDIDEFMAFVQVADKIKTKN
jgi:Ca2+-binding EF-hand superfamily protein